MYANAALADRLDPKNNRTIFMYSRTGTSGFLLPSFAVKMNPILEMNRNCRRVTSVPAPFEYLEGKHIQIC